MSPEHGQTSQQYGFYSQILVSLNRDFLLLIRDLVDAGHRPVLEYLNVSESVEDHFRNSHEQTLLRIASINLPIFEFVNPDPDRWIQWLTSNNPEHDQKLLATSINEASRILSPEFETFSDRFIKINQQIFSLITAANTLDLTPSWLHLDEQIVKLEKEYFKQFIRILNVGFPVIRLVGGRRSHLWKMLRAEHITTRQQTVFLGNGILAYHNKRKQINTRMGHCCVDKNVKVLGLQRNN